MKYDPPQSGELIEFGPFSFDRSRGKLSRHGITIPLRGMPLKMLQHLLEHPGEIVSRGELQSLLWSDTNFGDFEQGLNSVVNLVRRSLGDSADHARYIETVPSQGYRFIAPLRSAIAAQETASASAALDSGPLPMETNGIERPPAISEAPAGRNTPAVRFKLGIIATLVLAALGGGAWRAFQTKPQSLIDGATPSRNHEANDQYNLAFSFLGIHNDIPLARKTFEHALELDPHFASARLQRANMMVVEIYNGYANDGSALYQAEEELHQAERVLPGSDGLLLGAQGGLYLAQGRLDRIPSAKLEEWWRKGGDNGNGPPVLIVILRMLQGQTEEPLAIIRKRLESNPLENPTRMLLGELQRTQGDTEGAIHTLERVLQQAPRHLTPVWFLVMAYLDDGKVKEARALLEGMRVEFEKNYAWRHAWAMLLASAGKHEEARRAMDEGTLKFARLTWTATSTTADFYALQGDPSKAIEWLQLAIARGDERVAYFRRNPRLATLRNDTRFRTLLKSVEARHK